MPPDVTIRPGTLADLPYLIRHRRGMYEDMGYTDATSMDAMARASEQYFRAAVPDGTYRAWLATNGSKDVIAGGGIVISAWPGGPNQFMPKRAMILNMYVEPAYRRRGIARALMADMIQWCRDQGFSYVGLHASDKGRPLYESMGFLPTNEMRLELR